MKKISLIGSVVFAALALSVSASSQRNPGEYRGKGRPSIQVAKEATSGGHRQRKGGKPAIEVAKEAGSGGKGHGRGGRPAELA